MASPRSPKLPYAAPTRSQVSWASSQLRFACAGLPASRSRRNRSTWPDSVASSGATNARYLTTAGSRSATVTGATAGAAAWPDPETVTAADSMAAWPGRMHRNR